MFVLLGRFGTFWIEQSDNVSFYVEQLIQYTLYSTLQDSNCSVLLLCHLALASRYVLQLV